MSTFLQLVEDLRIESGASGRVITSIETEGLPAEIIRLKRWIANAWADIQRLHTDWNFLSVESSWTMAAGDRVLAIPPHLEGLVAEWKVERFKIADPGLAYKDSHPLEYSQYRFFRDGAGLDTETLGRPQVFTIHPNTEAIIIAPVADAAYSLWFDYYRTPQVLAEDGDTPIMPARYHQLIVAWALRTYGFHEVASEKLMQAKETISRQLSELEIDQLPDVTMSSLGD